MQSDWLSHKGLQIIRGIGATPGDANSAESNPVIVNLMAGKFSLVDWSPNIPVIKNGGVWADSPINDGRQLLAAPVGNVTEQITILVSDSTMLGVVNGLASLNKMALDCRDYWQSDYQIDPVYLMWWACGPDSETAPGPQYALLYNIEWTPEYLQSPTPSVRLSLTLERESAWRFIPPGANPRIWTFYVNASNPQYNVDVASLLGSGNLIGVTLKNKHEWVAAAYGTQTVALTKNYAEITADQVPGDAPALVEFSAESLSAGFAQLFVGRTSKPYSGRGHDGINRAVALNLNAGDGNTAGIVTKTVGTNLTGVRSNGSNTVYYYGERTATGIDANFVTACGWGGATGASGIKLDRQLYRGTFAIFARATNNSAAPAPVLTDMKMRVFIEEFEDAATQYVNSVTLPEVQVPLTISNPGQVLSYMGTVTLPLNSRAVVSPLGYGLQLQEANSNLRISLQLKYDVATANRIFRVIDIMLIPIDEGMTLLNGPLIANMTNIGYATYDNTGYLSRGEPGAKSALHATNANSGGIGVEIRGQDINLLPRTNQRVYFLSVGQFSSPARLESFIDDTITVRMNIVPRTYNIRDV